MWKYVQVPVCFRNSQDQMQCADKTLECSSIAAKAHSAWQDATERENKMSKDIGALIFRAYEAESDSSALRDTAARLVSIHAELEGCVECSRCITHDDNAPDGKVTMRVDLPDPSVIACTFGKRIAETREQRSAAAHDLLESALQEYESCVSASSSAAHTLAHSIRGRSRSSMHDQHTSPDKL